MGAFLLHVYCQNVHFLGFTHGCTASFMGFLLFTAAVDEIAVHVDPGQARHMIQISPASSPQS